MARFLSVCVLILSVAPMASLYVFYSLLYSPSSPSDSAHLNNFSLGVVHGTSDDGSSTATTTTVEEYVLKLIQERMNSNPYDMASMYSLPDTLGGSNHPTLQQFQQPSISSMCALLLPWAVSVTVGILIPLASCLYAHCTRRGGWMYKSQKKRRKQLLLHSMKTYQKVLTETDRATQHCNQTNSSGDNERVDKWTIPQPGTSIGHKSSPQRLLTEQCAICLTPYECSDTVVWSSNPDCPHAFHQGCVGSWLCRSKNRDTLPCPCCRQQFITKTIDINRT